MVELKNFLRTSNSQTSKDIINSFLQYATLKSFYAGPNIINVTCISLHACKLHACEFQLVTTA